MPRSRLLKVPPPPSPMLKVFMDYLPITGLLDLLELPHIVCLLDYWIYWIYPPPFPFPLDPHAGYGPHV